MGECLICAATAQTQYSLAHAATAYENEPLCDACADDLREPTWISITPTDTTPETSDPLTAHQARQQLYEIIRQDIGFEQKARKALALGEQYLNVANGHLTRIDTATDHWEAAVSTDPPDGQFPPGLELDLTTTYCRRTIQADSPITLHDAPQQGWADDPAYQTHELNCYHGSTLIVNNEPYGTVCFVDRDPRDTPFSDAETLFAELLSRLLERELERDHHAAELTKQTTLASVLNRVLRHNIRNDLAVVRGYTELMAEELDADTAPYGATVRNRIEKLLTVSEKARELDRIIATNTTRTPTDITGLVEQIVETLTREYPEASISITTTESITAPVLPSFERAVDELLENAAKHGGETPTITVSIEQVPNAVELQITDDGPGIPEQETAVLETGTETALTHGSGLGLWLAHWIVTSHDGTIDPTVTEDGTSMTITIPRAPTTNIQQQLANLTKARDRYEEAFLEAADPMVLVNDDRQIVDANEKAPTIYGLDTDELLGKPITDFLPAEFDVDAAWEEFKAAGTHRDTITIIDADGTERRIDYSAEFDFIPGEHLVIMRETTG